MNPNLESIFRISRWDWDESPFEICHWDWDKSPFRTSHHDGSAFRISHRDKPHSGYPTGINPSFPFVFPVFCPSLGSPRAGNSSFPVMDSNKLILGENLGKMVLERGCCKVQGGLHKEWELPSQNSGLWGRKWPWSPPTPQVENSLYSLDFGVVFPGFGSGWGPILLRSPFSKSSRTGKFLVFITRGLERAGNAAESGMEFWVFSRKSCRKQPLAQSRASKSP